MLNDLLGYEAAPCLSIYMPTHRAGKATEQDPIRLKNLLTKADTMLEEWGMDTRARKTFLEPAHRLLNDEERDFWYHQNDGLGLFIGEDTFHTFRLPVEFDETVVVNTRFYVTPLLPAISHENQFYILSLSQGGVRLLHGTRYKVSEVELTGMPLSLDESLNNDGFDNQLQARSIGSGAPGGRQTAFYSAGSDDDAKLKDKVREFLRDLDRGIAKLMNGTDAPLVLVGVEYIQSLYREASNYSLLVDEGIEGSPDIFSDKVMHERAWQLVEPLFKTGRNKALASYTQLAGQGDTRAIDDLEDILKAALYERIDTLLVKRGVHRWGTFDPTTAVATFHDTAQPGDEDLLDYAVAHTLKNSGTVYTLDTEEMSINTDIAALLRY